jgi:hypothetical protein
MIDKQSLVTFQTIYLHEFGVVISDDEAYQLASNLVNLYKAVYLEPKKEQEQPES